MKLISFLFLCLFLCATVYSADPKESNWSCSKFDLDKPALTKTITTTKMKGGVDDSGNIYYDVLVDYSTLKTVLGSRKTITITEGENTIEDASGNITKLITQNREACLKGLEEAVALASVPACSASECKKVDSNSDINISQFSGLYKAPNGKYRTGIGYSYKLFIKEGNNVKVDQSGKKVVVGTATPTFRCIVGKDKARSVFTRGILQTKGCSVVSKAKYCEATGTVSLWKDGEKITINLPATVEAAYDKSGTTGNKIYISDINGKKIEWNSNYFGGNYTVSKEYGTSGDHNYNMRWGGGGTRIAELLYFASSKTSSGIVIPAYYSIEVVETAKGEEAQRSGKLTDNGDYFVLPSVAEEPLAAKVADDIHYCTKS